MRRRAVAKLDRIRLKIFSNQLESGHECKKIAVVNLKTEGEGAATEKSHFKRLALRFLMLDLLLNYPENDERIRSVQGE